MGIQEDADKVIMAVYKATVDHEKRGGASELVVDTRRVAEELGMTPRQISRAIEQLRNGALVQCDDLVDGPYQMARFKLTTHGMNLCERGAFTRVTVVRPKEELVVQTSKSSGAQRVFVVHGHDDGLKSEVARFLERLGFEATILHEQADRGRTIIEKLEAESAGAAFAIIILTPDDIGGAREKEPHSRARQNVIFEWGFFVARLGRKHVVALKKGDVEIPSDLSGIIWKPVDPQWRYAIAKEMQNAGLDADLNKI